MKSIKILLSVKDSENDLSCQRRQCYLSSTRDLDARPLEQKCHRSRRLGIGSLEQVYSVLYLSSGGAQDYLHPQRHR